MSSISEINQKEKILYYYSS